MQLITFFLLMCATTSFSMYYSKELAQEFPTSEHYNDKDYLIRVEEALFMDLVIHTYKADEEETKIGIILNKLKSKQIQKSTAARSQKSALYFVTKKDLYHRLFAFVQHTGNVIKGYPPIYAVNINGKNEMIQIEENYVYYYPAHSITPIEDVDHHNFKILVPEHSQ